MIESVLHLRGKSNARFVVLAYLKLPLGPELELEVSLLESQPTREMLVFRPKANSSKFFALERVELLLLLLCRVGQVHMSKCIAAHCFLQRK